MQLKYGVAAVLVLTMLAQLTSGGIKDGRRAGKRDKIIHDKFHAKGIRRAQSVWDNVGHRVEHRHEKNRTADVKSASQTHLFGVTRPVGRVYNYDTHTPGRVTNHEQVHGQEFINGYLTQVQKLDNVSGAGHTRGHVSDRLSRARRALSTKLPDKKRPGGTSRNQSVTYTWTRDYGRGKSFNEAAFKSKDKNVVVILSFDEALPESNLTQSATLYDFTGVSGVMAIKPRTRPGPCFLVETSLTYDRISAELDSRNGSSVSTSTVISLDGTGSPVSLSERQAVVKKTPSLIRHCRGRKIIRTRPTGFSPVSSEGQTKELRVLTMDSELTLTVPVNPDWDFTPVNQWFESQRKNSGRGKGQGLWKGP